FGLYGSTVQVKGNDQIVVLLPGARRPEEALAQLQKVAQLSFYWLDQVQTPEITSRRYRMNHIPGDDKTPDLYTFTDVQTNQPVPTEKVLENSKLILKGSDLLPESNQSIGSSSGRAEPVVNFHFNAEGGRVFANFTTKNVGEYLAIVLDNAIISAPVIREPITEGHGQISGGFKTITEARNLAALLNSGSLPVPLKVAET